MDSEINDLLKKSESVAKAACDAKDAELKQAWAVVVVVVSKIFFFQPICLTREISYLNLSLTWLEP